MRSLIKTSMVIALAVVVGPAGLLASGFSIFEQSAKASGLAGAWVARADDAAANWYNPAALVWLDESQVQFGINFIDAGDDTDLTVLDPSFGVFSPVTFGPKPSVETPINLYYAHRSTGRWAWGIGVTTPFGLATEWQDRPITFVARRSALVTFVVNPNVAFKLGDHWSIGLGVDYLTADIEDFSREVPIDLDGNAFNGFEVIGFSNLTGDGDDFGFNVALLYRRAGRSFGLTYRSELSPEIDGTISYRNFGPLAGFFPSSPGTATLDLPAQAAIAYGWESRKWGFEFDIAWAGWSAFERLDVDILNETPLSRDFVIEENWDDTFSYRVGVTYSPSRFSTWRFGAVVDESPVPPEWLRPSIPDADRFGLTVGYGYQGPRWAWDLYYMALFFDDIDAVGFNDGVINGTYETYVNLAGVSLTRRF